MKARYKTFSVQQIDKEIRKAVIDECEKYKEECYDKVQWDCFQQALAVCFTALEMHGWRGKRLREFKNWVDDACHLMVCGAMGREYTTKDALKRMKEKYGIDLKESQYNYEEGEQ